MEDETETTQTPWEPQSPEPGAVSEKEPKKKHRKNASQTKAQGSRFGQWFFDNRFVFLTFGASAFLTLFVWFCLSVKPFGVRTVLRMDLYHQYGPLFAELYERIMGGRSLVYSWNTGLGGGFLGNLFNYLASPTGLLVVLFGHQNIPEAIGAMVLLKGALAAGFFAYMLRRLFGRNDAGIAAFGLLYCFCGFYIAYYWNVMWLDAHALLPLVALGIYNLLHHKKWVLYTVTLALCLITNYYMGFMVCIFSVLFFLALLAARSSEPLEAKARTLFMGCVRFGWSSLLGGGLAAFALLPIYFALKTSSATSGSFPTTYEFYFSFFDFIANHFADVIPTIRSSGDVVLPNVYSGVATLLLLPLYVLLPAKWVPTREKLAFCGLLLLFFFSFNFNVLNFLWHANHFPNDLPWRFSFIYTFVLLYVCYRTFMHIREIPAKAIGGAGIAALIFAVLADKVGQVNLQGSTVYITLGMLIVYTLLFIHMRRSPELKTSALSLLLLCSVVTEICAADTKNFEYTQEKNNYTPDLVSFQWVKRKIIAQDKSFFRMELTDLRTRMDPALMDYPGVSTFSSMAYEDTAGLEKRLGLGGNVINSYTYNPNTPVYNAMHNLKYLIENQSTTSPYSGSTYLNALNPEIYNKMTELTKERFTVFQNRYSLSLAYWVPQGMQEWSSQTSSNPFAVQADFWQRASGVQDVFRPLALQFDPMGEINGGVSPNVSEELVSFSGKNNGEEAKIPCLIQVEEPQNVYIYVNANYVNAIRVRRDGKDEWRSHDEEAIWDLGVVTPETPLPVDIYLAADEAPASGSFDVWVRGLDMQKFTDGYNVLKNNELNIKTHIDSLTQGTTLTGTITPPESGVLYTSIPYDESWKIAIDGKFVPTKSYIKIGGGFLGIPISPSQDHPQRTVSFHYSPRGLVPGAMVSGGSLLVLLAIWLISLLFKTKPSPTEDPPEDPNNETDGSPIFATSGLTASDFLLDSPPTTQAFPSPVPPHDPLLAAPIATAPAPQPALFSKKATPVATPVAAPPAKPAETSEVLTDNINSMLQQMQQRAEELRKKMRTPDEKPTGDNLH